jgi:hypothetical protein
MNAPVKRHSVAAKLLGAVVIAPWAQLRHKVGHYPHVTIKRTGEYDVEFSEGIASSGERFGPHHQPAGRESAD